MKNQSLLSSFIRKFFSVKIVANSALNKKHFCIVYHSCFGDEIYNQASNDKITDKNVLDVTLQSLLNPTCKRST